MYYQAVRRKRHNAKHVEIVVRGKKLGFLLERK
jgi:hypothetical protein